MVLKALFTLTIILIMFYKCLDGCDWKFLYSRKSINFNEYLELFIYHTYMYVFANIFYPNFKNDK